MLEELGFDLIIHSANPKQSTIIFLLQAHLVFEAYLSKKLFQFLGTFCFFSTTWIVTTQRYALTR
jgi:hypothetical protein